MSEAKNLYNVERAEDAGEPIDWFRGDFAFLSNFFESEVEVDGIAYPTAEHAFQAMKARETAARYHIRDAETPAKAKARGRKVPLREDWDAARFAEMERVLRAKFADPDLRAKLLATGDRTLIEGNNWKDTTWGAIKDNEGGWKGRNELGKLLMKIRDELRAEAGDGGEVRAEPPRHPQAELIAAALEARKNAYVPYSHYPVGAAIRTGSGAVVTGCNVENASYGLCNCAERTAVFTAVAAGERVVTAVAVATKDGGSPCGACRQVLSEFVPRDGTPVPVVLVDEVGTVVCETTMGELLPMAFALEG
jgi:cytidine deaminase, homotetrameric